MKIFTNLTPSLNTYFWIIHVKVACYGEITAPTMFICLTSFLPSLSVPVIHHCFPYFSDPKEGTSFKQINSCAFLFLVTFSVFPLEVFLVTFRAFWKAWGGEEVAVSRKSCLFFWWSFLLAGHMIILCTKSSPAPDLDKLWKMGILYLRQRQQLKLCDAMKVCLVAFACQELLWISAATDFNSTGLGHESHL